MEHRFPSGTRIGIFAGLLAAGVFLTAWALAATTVHADHSLTCHPKVNQSQGKVEYTWKIEEGVKGETVSIYQVFNVNIVGFISPSQPVRISSDGSTDVARFGMALNFQASESESPVRSRHTGGANFLFADGSVQLFQATDTRLITDTAGNLLEIQATMVDTRTGFSWSFQILPFIEEDDLYDVFVTGDEVQYQFAAVGHLLPMRPTDPVAVDPCLPAAGDVFRPEHTERFGHLDGDAARAEGVWGLRLSPADHRTYFADHESVLAIHLRRLSEAGISDGGGP